MAAFVIEILGSLLQGAMFVRRPWLAWLMAAPFLLSMLFFTVTARVGGFRILALAIAAFATGLVWLVFIATQRNQREATSEANKTSSHLD